MKKGQVWISAVLYLLLISVVLIVVLEAGKPILESLQDKGVFSRSKNTFSVLDSHVSDVASQGPGSQRVVTVELEKGNLVVNDGALQWDLDTDARILESGHEQDYGNVKVSSNADVSAEVHNDSTYVLRNTFVEVYISRCEELSTCVFDGRFIEVITFRNFGNPVNATGNFNFSFGNITYPAEGYSIIRDQGSDIGAATVEYVFSSNVTNATSVLELTLRANKDYLEARIK